MRRFVFCALILLGALTASGDGRTRAANRPTPVSESYATPVAGPWHVELTTSGGFGGIGGGDIKIDSTGKVAVGYFSPGNKNCEYTLTAEELSSMNTLVMSIHPDSWVSSYIPADTRKWCCDLIFTKIGIERQEYILPSTRIETGRYETNLLEPFLTRDTPRDLIELWTALRDLKRVYMDRCFSHP